jgi:hypothetical protein
MPRTYTVHRKDVNHDKLVKAAKRCGAHWIHAGPFDGWIHIAKWGGEYLPVEIKDPDKEGHKDEFTEKQRKLREEWADRRMKLLIWRSESDVIRDLGGRS